MKRSTAVFALVLFLGCVAIQPNAEAQGLNWGEEYAKRIKATEIVAPLGDSTFGDSINLFNGTVSFAATDISIPGNNALPVELTRTYDLSNVTSQRPVGVWEIKAPHLHAVHTDRPALGYWAPLQRCSTVAAPPTHGTFPNSFTARDYWSGTSLRDADGGGDLLAVSNNPKLVKPATALHYPWVNKAQWFFSCLPALQNGLGEGFVGHAPDGTSYIFNWMVVREYPGISRKDPNQVHPISVERKSVRLYATEVRDRFGNWVRYDWSGGRLNRIHSNDGREIALVYANDQLASATARTVGDDSVDSQRTWTYQYTGSALSSVTNPDGSTWKYASRGQGVLGRVEYIQAATGGLVRDDDLVCSPTNEMRTEPAVFAITSPSGATAEYSFRAMRHGRTNVKFRCMSGTDDDMRSDYNDFAISHDVKSLQSKVVSGPGMTTQSHAYHYASLEGGYRPVNPETDALTGATPAPHYKWVTVTEPDGTQQIHTFGKDYELNEGQLFRVETRRNGQTLKVREHSYVTEAEVASQLFPSFMGSNLVVMGDNFSAAGQRPMKATTITQDGVTFSTSTPQACAGGTVYCFDAFVRSTRQVAASSLGYSKTDITTYHDNPGNWVLGQVASVTNVNTGRIESATTYDANDLPWKTYQFSKLQQTLTYDTAPGPEAGTLAAIADGRGNATTLSDWHRGIPRTITFPATPDQPIPVSRHAVVNGFGWITEVTSENGTGYTTTYRHDRMGRLARLIHPPGEGFSDTTQTFEPSTAGKYGLPANHWRQTVSTGSARKVTYFDGLWRPIVTESYDAFDEAGTRSIHVTRYDDGGNVAFQSYPMRSLSDYRQASVGSTHEYDALDRVTAVRQSSELGLLVTTSEYLQGFKQKVTLPKWQGTGVSTVTEYMARGQPSTDLPVRITHPEGAVTTIERNMFGQARVVARGSSAGVLVERRNVYDAFQQVCKRIEPETGTTVMDYDAAGNLAWSANGLELPATTGCDQVAALGSGRVAMRTYDQRNRLTALDFPDTRGSQTWKYKADGLPWQVRTSNVPGTLQTVNTYEYNKRRLLTSESVLQGNFFTYSLGYGYDGNGNLASHTYPSGQTVVYSPNALGQPTGVASLSQGTTYASGISYHPNGAIRQFTYGNGIVHEMSQSARQLPATVKFGDGVGNYQYGFDANANVASIVDNTAGQGGRTTRSMAYDGLDRLTAAISPMFGSDPVAAYAYDALDNLRRVKANGRDHTYSYNARHHLETINDTSGGVAVIGLGYDVQGNLRNKNGALFDFDFGNRLRESSGPNMLERYRYDAHGRRVLASRNLGPPDSIGVIFSQYANGGQLMYQDNQRAGVNKTIDQIYLGGSLIAQREVARVGGAVTVKYLHTDALGSPVAVTNAAGGVVERMEYEPYGSTIGGSPKDGPGYTGHVLDAATGMNYMQQRYYDPGIGRFLSTDPVTADATSGENFNRYWYANNNPYKFIDPDGRATDEPLRQARDWRSLSAHASNLSGIGAITSAASKKEGDENSTKIKFNAPAPRTVPPSGANGKALQCVANCSGLETLLVTGGAETSRHSRNSAHYEDKAVDIPGPPYNKVSHSRMMTCAASCGYTHGWWEVKGSSERNHWHFQIGARGRVPPLPPISISDGLNDYGSRMDGARSGQ